MSDSEDTTQPIFVKGKKVAVLRNGGTICDVRRHGNGFLYHGGFKVAVAEELLESLPDTVLLQFTHLDTKDVWTITVHDFRHWCEPVRFGNYELQRACEIVRMNHTIEGGSKGKKQRLNELLPIESNPVPEYKQDSLFG